MRRVCVAIGEIWCSDCQRVIGCGERYLVVEEDDAEQLRFCLDCGVSKGYATYVMEKGKQILTFSLR